MKDAIRGGEVVILDRYAFSGVAFSSAKGLDMEWCISPDKGILAPDALFYLDLKIEDAQGRGGFGEERYEKVEFQKKVADKFMSLKDPTWKILDAKVSKEELHEKIVSVVEQVLQNTQNEPLKLLWVD